jgi:mRNA interferase RelE/StbE
VYRLEVSLAVIKELGDPKGYPARVYRQITLKIFELGINPRPPDVKPIATGYRVDVGADRIFYEIDDRAQVVLILLAGKRGDDEIYRRLKRWLG